MTSIPVHDLKSRRPLYLYLLGVLLLGLSSVSWSAESRNRTQAQSASSQKTNIDAARQNDLMIVQIPTGSTARALWRTNITLDDSHHEKSRQTLQGLINRINAFRFQGKAVASQPLAAPPVPNRTRPIMPPEANLPPEANVPAEPVKSEKVKPTTDTQGPTEILEQTRQTFLAAVQHPESLPDPLALAELLFRADHLDEAALCYQEAFKRTTQMQTEKATNGDWMLFQIGNCLRKSDPSAALEAYQQLMTQYTESPWVPIARVKSKWIDWMVKDDPRGLLEALP